ncbi:MAG: DUF4912 domain-containing protein [Peptococcaceae bacterium]|jgi:hypothetical protein|nr:DUF4912 domain-containing protein [Peptococcaceae bacterium]
MEKEEKAPRLSAGYNENVLVLLVQNPTVVFAYLELSENFWGALVQHGRPVLRLYDVTAGHSTAGHQVVVEEVVPPFTANWYFRGLVPGRTYAGELGWRDEQGLFVSLLRSNPAATPSNERVWTQGGKKMVSALADPPARSAHPPEAEEEEEGEADLPSSYSS